MKVFFTVLKAARRLCLAGLFLALLHCSAAQPEEPSDTPSPAAANQQPSQEETAKTFPPLSTGQAQRVEIAKGQLHYFPLNLRTGDYLHLTVDQAQADVALTLLDPDNKPVMEVNSPDDTQVIESLHFVADRAGGYKLMLKPAHALASGSYGIGIDALRPAQIVDQAKWEAFQLMTTAQDQFRQGTSEALDKAFQSCREAADRWDQAQQRFERALALKQMGEVSKRQGRVTQELGFYEQALELFRELGDQAQQVDLMNSIGEIRLHRTEAEDAIEIWREALELAERATDGPGKAALLNSLAVYYRTQGETKLALLHYGQALELFHALGRPAGEALVRENRGYLHMEAGNYLQALDDLKMAVEIFGQLERPNDQAYALARMASVKFRQKHYLDAIQLYESAIETRRNIQDEVGNASVLANLGDVYGALGQTEKAFQSYQRSLAIFSEESHLLTRAAILTQMGELFLKADQPERALPYLSQASSLYSGSQEPGVQASVQYLYAKAERRFGRLAVAKDLTDKVLATLEGLRRKSPGRHLRADFWASRYDCIEFYIDLLMQMNEEDPAAGYDIEAFEASQRSRAKGLYESLAMAGAAQRASDPDLAERRHALNEQIRLLVQSNTGNSVESELRDLLIQRDLLQYGNPGGQAAMAAPLPDIAAVSLQRIQNELLSDDTLLLAFSLGQQRSFLWAVGRASFASYVLPSRPVIEKQAQNFYQLLARSQSSLVQGRLQAAATGLAEMLLGEVRAKLGSKRLLIAPDGILHIVPFSALMLDRGTDPLQPLLIRHDIVNIPSVPVLALLRRQAAARSAAPKAVAVWADPVFSPSDDRLRQPPDAAGQPAPSQRPSALRDFLVRERAGDPELRNLKRLPASRQEAEAILSLVPEDQSFKALDFAASRESVLATPLDQYRILHFATHGLLYPNLSGISGVALSMVDQDGRMQDGLLPAHEIYNLHLNANLVVISACKSALGRPARGEGIVGLSQGFLYAGAARVVVSLWNVHDYATSQLMAKFYSNMLLEKMSPSAALRQAQIEMRKAKHWSRPYFWAGFMLQGEWN